MMTDPFYAHTLPGSGGDTSKWEPLFTPDCQALQGKPCKDCDDLAPDHGHLNKVASWTAKFAEAMFPPGTEDAKRGYQWGHLVGLWHDLGKFAREWQAYLRRKSGTDIHRDEVIEREDHATAGAQHAVKTGGTLGHLLAYAIAGHHSGLLDAISENACLDKRLTKEIRAFPDAPPQILHRPLPPLPESIRKNIGTPAVGAMFTRMLFSALVDADFLATEAFMNPAQSRVRRRADPTLLPRMAALLDEKHASFPAPDDSDKVGKARAEVHAACIEKATLPPGLFSLTVPTGGGKTLSSLAFALRHAIAHGQQRVIYVIPFTSIIEQNAGEFEKIFRSIIEPGGDPVVLQHHSNLSPERETTRSRLATENWDAPLVVTTAVQFYESLHAARTSGCRKLHHIANAVVILDEAQCLPVQYLKPCLDALRELTARYRTTAVLCTATQPEIRRTEDFRIGLEDVREIIPQPRALYAALRRVRVIDRGKLADAALAGELATPDQSSLVIVNTRGHAQALFRLLPPAEGNFHLSALMCPAHREQVLTTVRDRLKRGLPVRLISTQLIEAGVNVDFPRVYRAMAGIDSLAQAAGRCNREGKLPFGELHVFRSEHEAAERYFRETAQIAEQMFTLFRGDDVLGLDSVEKFFRMYYLQHKTADGPQWDAKDICSAYKLDGKPKAKLPLLYQFDEVAEKFRLIENEQVSVLIPFDDDARSLLAELRNESIPLHRDLLRGLQRYAVQIYQRAFVKNRGQFESVRNEQFHVVICPEINYSTLNGLFFPSDPGELLYC